MIQHADLFPDDSKSFSLCFDNKTGTLRKGKYQFHDFYCGEKNCDCRRTIVSVLNDKGTALAYISFGFDPNVEGAGPYLEPSMPQSRHAELLLEIFTDLVNTVPVLLELLYKHYRQIREKIDGKKYKGRAFPRPGSVIRTSDAAQDSRLSEEFVVSGKTLQNRDDGRTRVLALLSQMIRDKKRKKFSGPLPSEMAMEESPELSLPLIDLLAEGAEEDSAGAEDRRDCIFALLRAVFEQIRTGIERRRPEAITLNEAMQRHLADKLFQAGPASFLAGEVVHNLAECRLEPLPFLAEAFQQMMISAFDEKVVPFPGADPLAGLLLSLEEIGMDNVFERFAYLTDQFRLATEEMQLQLASEFAVHKSPVLREIAGLMPFHPLAAVRDNIPAILTAVGADKISPQTLLRLILSRNWHAPHVRVDIDRTIADARRAGVQCAQLREAQITEILASPIDGSGAQGIWIISKKNGQHLIAGILIKLTDGIVDAWLTHPLSSSEAKNMHQSFKVQAGGQPVASWLLKQMVGHALATVLRQNRAVPAGLLEIVEVLGISGWKPEAIDPAKLLVSLREELAPGMAAIGNKVLAESESWPMSLPLACSWFEDDRDVDVLLSRMLPSRRLTPAVRAKAVDAVVRNILEHRRTPWVERLALTTLWLKAATGKAQIAPEKMLLVAEHVAEAESFDGAGLMRGVAQLTINAYLGRSGENGQ